MVEPGHPEIALNTQAELLGLSRASLYYRPMGPSAQEIGLKNRIDEIYTLYPIYGSRRMKAVLCREGWISRHVLARNCPRLEIAFVLAAVERL